MRGLNTPVKKIRRKVFTEIAKVGFQSTPESLIADIEAIPYTVVQERATYRESIYRERDVYKRQGRYFRVIAKCRYIDSCISDYRKDIFFIGKFYFSTVNDHCSHIDPPFMLLYKLHQMHSFLYKLHI